MPEGKLLEELAAEADCYISSLRDVSGNGNEFSASCWKWIRSGIDLKEWEYTAFLSNRENRYFFGL